MPDEKKCAVPGCGRPRHTCGRGYNGSRYCTTHHVRMTKHGDPYADVPIEVYRGRSLAQRREELAEVR